MYTLKDLSENNLVLRPEGTAGLMRMILETNQKYQLPKKLYYTGPMFRYERPQKGRLRQFYQIGIIKRWIFKRGLKINDLGAENIGFKDYFGDVEIILIAYEILQSLKPDLAFKVLNLLINKWLLQINKDWNKYFRKFWRKERI